MIAAPMMSKDRWLAGSLGRWVLAAAALAAIASVSTAAHAETVDKILATIDGEPVTMYEVQQFTADQMHTPGTNPDSANLDPKAALDACITEKIIEMEISDKGIVVRDEDIDRYIEGIRAQNNISMDRLKQAVETQGMSWDGYRKRVRLELEKGQLINREIRGKVNVTPEDVQRYYEKHKDEYSTPGTVHLRHIVLLLPKDASAQDVAKVMAKAKDLRQKIADGADFAEVAKQYSQDAAASSGGDLGFVKKGGMLDAIEKAAEKLKVGEVSQPIQTSAGIHLIKLEGVQQASSKLAADEADEIKKQLYNAALEERYQRWLTEDLRKLHHVEILM